MRACVACSGWRHSEKNELKPHRRQTWCIGTITAYEHLSAEQAFALAERFEFIYTPKGGSWLNMIECEFSVVSRQCLDRRIATLEQLRSEVLALLQERSAKQIKVHWQFSIQAARAKLNSSYTRVNSANEKYNETSLSVYSVH